MHPIENIMHTSLEQIRSMTEVGTVVGEPIRASEDTVLLPVSKVSLGFIVGGGEYGSLSGTGGDRRGGESGNFPFAGESAVGMSLKPLSFVAVEQGSVRVLPASPSTAGDRFADVIPRMLDAFERLASAVIDNLTKKCENRGCDGYSPDRSFAGRRGYSGEAEADMSAPLCTEDEE